MPAVSYPTHQKGDYLVDFEEKVFEDVNKKDLDVTRKCIEKIVLNMSLMESDESSDENEKQ